MSKQDRRVTNQEATPCPSCGEMTEVGWVKAWYPGTNTYRCVNGHDWEHDIQFDDPFSEAIEVENQRRWRAKLPELTYEEIREIGKAHGKNLPADRRSVTMTLSNSQAEVVRVDLTDGHTFVPNEVKDE